MTGITSNIVNTVATGGASTGPFITQFFDRAPTSLDVNNWKIGQRWIDTSASPIQEYILMGFTASNGVINADWQELGETSEEVNTLTGNSGGAVGPDATNGNINVVGDAVGITIVGVPASNTLTASLVGGGIAVQQITPDTGTNPVVPTALGVVAVRGQNPASVSGIRTTGALNELDIAMFSPFVSASPFVFGSGTPDAVAGSDRLPLAIAQSVVGGVVYQEIKNNDGTNTASGARIDLTTNGAGAGDPALFFDITGANSYTMGIDNSDSDSFKLDLGANLGSATNILTVTTAGTLTNNLGDINAVRALAGGRVAVGVQNTDASPGSSACLLLDAAANSGDPYIMLDTSEGAPQAIQFGLDTTDSNAYTVQINPSNSGGPMDGTTAWRMTIGVPAAGVGCITKPLQPAFLAVLTVNSSNVTGNGAVYVLSSTGGGTLTEVFDQNGNFVPATGTFTAPVTGKYYFKARFLTADLTAGMTNAVCSIVTTTRTFNGGSINAGAAMNVGNQLGIEISCFADMTAGNTAITNLTISGGAGDTADVIGSAITSPNSWFEGYLVC